MTKIKKYAEHKLNKEKSPEGTETRLAFNLYLFLLKD